MNFSIIKDQIFQVLLVGAALLTGCQEKGTNSNAQLHLDPLASSDTLTTHLKPFDPALPTIGLLMYNGVLQSEVVATSDVFAKLSEAGQQLFNVITIAETKNPITTEEGLHLLPDYTFENAPKLTAIFVPSAYDMWSQVRNEKIVNFIKEKNKEVDYVVSNCGGAQLIGASGVADGHKIVTWIGGGPDLQKEYPNLLVQDENEVTYVRDGRFLSSNGNLASYVSALELLEIMTSPDHRKFVESYLYLDRLQNWGR
ncbi:DJ-1/PfpI family protein [Algoriphagus zhangzhouensis]|uniref:DJ-1/PfpI family protein n=1 Tax=Algoriphagus zhangzhouensis TaxID=1073327 RepID=A0A1M7Z7U6_9BACT|nr:DJ-1/PfpI family protein [Algoriphagus zhangzhouensis]TDY49457.1 DJ-1/PfpI family protein [Algoriphagus zhangzhouensis]SHO60971.1 DJ-1/PfpI family protein [Algoriphagus zhangzhouensis]